MYLDNITTAFASVRGSSLAPNLHGNVFFYSVPGGTDVSAEFWGLPLYQPATNNSQPIGPFGFHVHEYGVCEITDPDNPFLSAGSHYNPTDQPHGNHAGDFPVVFSNNGYARMNFFTDKFKPADIIGKSVLLHQNPDDFKSQPAGNSGKRMACGVINGVY